MIGCSRWQWDDSLVPLRRLLERGGILAIPTESSYGLAVDPTNAAAVASIFELKGREDRKPLPVVIGDLAQGRLLGAELDDPVLAPLIALWPAPLTLVVPLRRRLAASAGARSVALRMPRHRRLQELLLRLGTGLTATSANLSGGLPATDPAVVVTLLDGRDAAVVDDGILPGGAPSTIVELKRGELRILRIGAFPRARLVGLEGLAIVAASGTN